MSDYIEVARFVGLDPFAILKRAQVAPRWLDDPDAPIALRSVVQVLEDSASISGRDDFGVLLAETRVFSSLGPVSLVLEHEHSVRAVLETAIEFRPLINPSLKIKLEECDGISFVHFNVPAQFGTPQFLSHVIAVAVSVLTDVSGGRWHPCEVHFRHGPPRWSASYRRHFACPLCFESEADGFSCSTSSLDTGVPSAEAVLARYARNLLNLSPEAQGSENIAHHVRSAIHVMLRHGLPTLRMVSANLAMAPRTLQRQLKREGRTFEELLREVRRDLAMRYLGQTRLEITQVALNLGFASSGSLSRWFTAEFGMSPSAWRRQRVRQN